MKRRTISILSFPLLLILVTPGVISAFSFSSASSDSYGNTTAQGNIGDPKIVAVLEMIDEQLLRSYLEPLVGYGPRVTGTYGCEKAAMFIYSQFSGIGLVTRYHNWTAWGNMYHFHRFNSQNVEGMLRGSDDADDSVLLFSAHYDSYKGAPGANDDGSGTAAVLAAAFALSHFSFKRTVKFVTFAGEEEGLLGSHAYAKDAYSQQENILVNINADMIGHATTAAGGRTMGMTATEDAAWMFDICEHIDQEYGIPVTLRKGSINRDGRGWSDYFSFVEYGWEALACWGGEHDAAMHTPDDDLDNVNFSYLVNTTRMIAGTLAYLADAQDIAPQVRITSPYIGYLYVDGLKKRALRDLKTMVIDDIWVWAEVFQGTVPITRAEFYYDDRLAYTDTEPPFKWNFNAFSLRPHRITVIVYDQLGRKSMDSREIRFINILKRR